MRLLYPNLYHKQTIFNTSNQTWKRSAIESPRPNKARCYESSKLRIIWVTYSSDVTSKETQLWNATPILNNTAAKWKKYMYKRVDRAYVCRWRVLPSWATGSTFKNDESLSKLEQKCLRIFDGCVWVCVGMVDLCGVDRIFCFIWRLHIGVELHRNRCMKVAKVKKLYNL